MIHSIFPEIIQVNSVIVGLKHYTCRRNDHKWFYTVYEEVYESKEILEATPLSTFRSGN